MDKTKSSRFQKGSGCYKCSCCGKQTRDTGNDEGGAKMCRRCYEIGGDENCVADGLMTVEEFVKRWGQQPDC